MKGRTIIRDGGRSYSGQYVATASFNNNTVVAAGKNPDKVRESAAKQGYEKPVIIYVPKKGTVCLF